MWFGDLVTMRWWDDLWLNESFAEYMGYLVTAEATRFTSAWTSFIVGRKGWGYAADQRPSTHPIAPTEMPDTSMALLNFDGISYAKGASVLRQLSVWLGEETFLAGVRSHFAAHAFGNATLADLLASLSAAAGQDLSGWAEVWLRQAQVNTLRPEVSVGPDGRYASVAVVQTAPAEHVTPRPHRFGIGVYRGGSLRHRVMLDLDPGAEHGRTEVPELTGVEVGDLLLLNDGDLTYAKIRFDPATRAALPTVLPELADPVARALIWAAVADAVRDGEVPVSDLVALFEAAFATETEVAVMKDLLRFVTTRTIDATAPMRGIVGRFLPPSTLAAAEARIAQTCLRAVEAAAPGSGRQLMAARGAAYAAGADEVDLMRAWLAGTRVPAGLDIDVDMRWLVLTRLAVLGAVDQREIESQAARDRTASGVEHAARCRAALPDPAVKARAWDTIMADDTQSNRLIAAAAEGFWSARHGEVTRSYVPRYFDEAPAMAARRSPAVAIDVAEGAYPRFAVDPQTVALAEGLIARTDVSPGLRRAVVDYTDDLRRALVGRTLERS
jgi:aminopeptidase N